MANGINKVILIGNLGQDPEIRFTASGNAVANVNIATTSSWNDRNTGQRQEQTEWHRVVMFNKVAEIAQQYLTKGARVYIEGRLQTRKWQDQNNQDRYTTEIVCNDMQMLGGGQQGGGQQGGGQQQQAPQGNQQQATQGNQTPQGNQQQTQQGGGQQQQAPQGNQSPQGNQPQGGGGDNFDDFDDEIPF